MWYVLYTKPRNEKKTARLLEEKGIRVYCPVKEVIKQWSDRKKKVAEPLFNSYLFVYLAHYQSQHVEVLHTPGAVRFLWWQKKPGIVREEEIEAIKSFLNCYKSVNLKVEFEKGAALIVTEGPFKGQTGSLIRTQSGRATLYLRSLNWNVIADFPVNHLERNVQNDSI